MLGSGVLDSGVLVRGRDGSVGSGRVRLICGSLIWAGEEFVEGLSSDVTSGEHATNNQAATNMPAYKINTLCLIGANKRPVQVEK